VPYRLVIFDFDGTLADSYAWFLSVLNRVAAEFGFPAIPPEEIEELRRLSARAIVKRQRVPVWKLPRTAARVHELMARDAAAIRPFPGVVELLDALAANDVRIALVTSNSEANVRAILGPAAVARIEHFDCGAALFGKARKFRRTMKRLKVKPAETLCVGDELRDHDAARAARAAFGAVAWGYTHPEALQANRPDHFFSSLDDLARTVLPAA
jgi:phosphoglycolate phosphatase